MRYCVYLRKSRADAEAEARGEGDAFARHELILSEFARRADLNVTQTYKETVSGETIAARPVMRQLLGEVERGEWSGVLVIEIERLARGDTVDQGVVAQTFKYSGTKIITPLKTYDPRDEYDEEYFEFGLFMSRREYKTINRRMQRGRAASVKEGKYLGSVAPYGYSRRKLERGGYTLAPHAEESQVVRLIFELYTQGDGGKRIGFSGISKKLNELKLKPRVSREWSAATIGDILMNPVYIGKVRWNRRAVVKKMINGEFKTRRPRAAQGDYIIADGLHEAIIDTEAWEAAQEIRKKNPPRPAPSEYGVKNPLAGLVFCGKCGRSMIRRPYNKADKPDVLMCPFALCDNVSAKLRVVEKHIITALEKWLADYTVEYGGIIEKTGSNALLEAEKNALLKITADIGEAEIQLSNLCDLLERGVYSSDIYTRRFDILTQRLHSLRRAQTSLTGKTAPEKPARGLPDCERITDIYRKSNDPALKNDLLREVLERVVYIKNAAARYKDDDDFELRLFPKLPPTDNMTELKN